MGDAGINGTVRHATAADAAPQRGVWFVVKWVTGIASVLLAATLVGMVSHSCAIDDDVQTNTAAAAELRERVKSVEAATVTRDTEIRGRVRVVERSDARQTEAFVWIIESLKRLERANGMTPPPAPDLDPEPAP